jgi:ankyrin repeat protein
MEAANAIFRAAREGDVGEVVRLLDAQPDLMEANEPNEQWSLLYEAAREGHTDVAEALLARGANVNRGDSTGFTPIHAAAFNGHEEVVTVLLRAGADIRLKGGSAMWTILTAACFEGHLGVTRLLLRHMRGEGLDERDDDTGSTALLWAYCLRQAEVCRALLLAGADHTIADYDAVTPRQRAQQEEDNNPCMAVFEVGALTTSHVQSTQGTTEWEGTYLDDLYPFPRVAVVGGRAGACVCSAQGQANA